MKSKREATLLRVGITGIAAMLVISLSVYAFSQAKQVDRKKEENQTEQLQPSEKDKKASQSGQGSVENQRGAGVGPNGPKRLCDELFDGGEDEPVVAVNLTNVRKGATIDPPPTTTPATGQTTSNPITATPITGTLVAGQITVMPIISTGAKPMQVKVPNCAGEFDLPVTLVIKRPGTWFYRFVEVPGSFVGLANPSEKDKLYPLEVKEPCEEHKLVGRLKINGGNRLRKNNYEIKVEMLRKVVTTGNALRKRGAAQSSGNETVRTFRIQVVCELTPVEIKPNPILK